MAVEENAKLLLLSATQRHLLHTRFLDSMHDEIDGTQKRNVRFVVIGKKFTPNFKSSRPKPQQFIRRRIQGLQKLGQLGGFLSIDRKIRKDTAIKLNRFAVHFAYTRIGWKACTRSLSVEREGDGARRMNG